MSDAVIIAALTTIAAIFTGAGAAFFQMLKSRRAGVQNEHVQAEVAPPEPMATAPSSDEGFGRLVETLFATQDRTLRRLDHMEAWNVTLGDHVDVLENHIWLQKPPPPPARPKYVPYSDIEPKE